MENPIILNPSKPQFTVDTEIMIVRFVFTRTDRHSADIAQLLDNNGNLAVRFNRNIDLDWRERHPDLLNRLTPGIYKVVGMREGDTLTIEWKPIPTPAAPVIIDSREIERIRNTQFRKRGKFVVPVN